MSLPVRERPGTGPLVVFVHGSMDRGAAFARTAAGLPGSNLCRYDRRGYGASLGTGPAVGIDGHVADLLEVADGRRCAVVGHSYGGVVALAAAARCPEVVAGVLAFEAPMAWRAWWPPDTAGGGAVRAGDGEAAAEAFLRRMLGDDRYERLPAKAARLAEGDALLAELASVRGGSAPYDPRDLVVPVVAGRGSASGAHLRRAAAELADEAPFGELVEIEGAGHGAHLSHPAEFTALVRRLLARLRG